MRGHQSEWDETVGAFKYEIEIPDGYFCSKAWMTFSHVTNYLNGVGQPETNLQIDVRNKNLKIPIGWNTNFNGSSQGTGYSYAEDNLFVLKTLPIGVSVFNVGAFSLNVIAECYFTQESYDQWRQQAYIAIVSAYQKRYQEYLDSKMAEPEEEEPIVDYNMNPGKARSIEARELKRACIELMGHPLSAYYENIDLPNLTSNNHHYLFSTNVLGYYGNFIIKNERLDRHAQVIKFFEEAFEWDLMSYTFHPYFSGERDSWEQLLKQKAPADPLFEAFLQSGFATVQLTVKPEYERMVLYFLDTGAIPPNKEFIPAGDLNVYTALLGGLKVYTEKEQEERKLVKTWETRLPTDLVILQSGARPLKQNGLPCKCKDGIAQEGLGTGTDEEMSTLQPYTSDYGDLISDVKNAVIDVVKGVVPVFQGAGGDKEPANPGTGGTTDGGTTGGTTDGGSNGGTTDGGGNGDNPDNP